MSGQGNAEGILYCLLPGQWRKGGLTKLWVKGLRVLGA
jgi:uncharacterized protein YjeT (DUF2065 family)